jgi:hypothetical protein
VIADWVQWRRVNKAAANRHAGQIARQVNAASVMVREHKFTGRSGWIALFEVAHRWFAFVPGGETVLGYDAGRFAGTPEQNASYAATAAEYGIPLGIKDYIASVTSSVRAAVVPPLLISVTAAEAGLVPVPPSHPEITRLLADQLDPQRHRSAAPRQVEVHNQARMTLNPDWTVAEAWLLETPSYEQVTSGLADAGQRLLTPDEWEHACGAGAATLFRWGDDCPANTVPGAFTSGPQREPNRFGLDIAQDPYRAERTADPAVVCGGDGGGMICGGAGAFVSWLTIATAYRDPSAATLDSNARMYLRPAIPLAP